MSGGQIISRERCQLLIMGNIARKFRIPEAYSGRNTRLNRCCRIVLGKKFHKREYCLAEHFIIIQDEFEIQGRVVAVSDYAA